jgi:hypothetical protein
MIIAKTKAEFEKIPPSKFDHVFGGNVDVSGRCSLSFWF